MTSTPAQVSADFVNLGIEGRKKLQGAVVKGGELLKAAVKRHANQPRTQARPAPRPNNYGPRNLTGEYLRSITRKTTHFAGQSVSIVGSNQIRARRLELGFVGQDALGREIDQVPYPHFGPGLDEVGPAFEDLIDEALDPGAAR